MKACICLIGVSILVATVTGPAFADDPKLGSLKLLPGYKHQPLQGFDSIVGKITKEKGLSISYEIGSVPKPGGLAIGGQFSDRPKQTPAAQRRWYREQTVNGQPVHLAHLKDDTLLVSFPEKGMNFSAKVTSAEEMADALLMILTYPEPNPSEAATKESGQAK